MIVFPEYVKEDGSYRLLQYYRFTLWRRLASFRQEIKDGLKTNTTSISLHCKKATYTQHNLFKSFVSVVKLSPTSCVDSTFFAHLYLFTRNKVGTVVVSLTCRSEPSTENFSEEYLVSIKSAPYLTLFRAWSRKWHRPTDPVFLASRLLLFRVEVFDQFEASMSSWPNKWDRSVSTPLRKIQPSNKFHPLENGCRCKSGPALHAWCQCNLLLWITRLTSTSCSYAAILATFLKMVSAKLAVS